MASPWPVEIRPVGQAACATMAWRFRDQLRVTAIVKVTLPFSFSGSMALGDPEAIRPVEIHYGREWSLFSWRERCAEVAKGGFRGIGLPVGLPTES